MTSRTRAPRRVGRVPALIVSLPVVLLGLLLVLFALFKAPWPPDPARPGVAPISQYDRARGRVGEGAAPLSASEKTRAWHIRRAMDALVYGLLALSCVSLALSLGWHERLAARLLVITGVGGILYSSFVGLYAGPIVAIGGFSLVLFGAGLGWASQCANQTMLNAGPRQDRI